MSELKPVVLCILDGWGVRSDRAGNAPVLAKTPNFDRLMAQCPNAQLITHGPQVGLPSGQMGNSEVGHTNIGAGRVVSMDLGQIDLAIEDESFFQNQPLMAFAAEVGANTGTAHVFSLVSDGGVHGHITHLKAAVQALVANGIQVVVHAITDGRDVAPRSADGFIQHLCDSLPEGARIGTVIGRYFAMDRDNRWERTQAAYDAIATARAPIFALDALTALEASYARGDNDEFITPTIIGNYQGMQNGDALMMMNFRADRARQLLTCFCDGFWNLPWEVQCGSQSVNTISKWGSPCWQAAQLFNKSYATLIFFYLWTFF